MDKNAIKKYAVWARQQLIEKVTTKAIENAICDGQDLDDSLSVINGKPIDEKTKKQRKALIKKIKEEGYTQVMEEVAYTWFNRFVAIRFMEVNGYLPSHVRVFSDESGAFRPQILAEAIHLELEGLDKEKVFQLQDEANNDELFKYLLIVQCNALNEVLPYMFQKLEDYTELLLPDYLLREGSVIEKLVNEIPEDNFNIESDNGQVEIIGWMYQYYISEKHEEVVDPLHGKVVAKEEVPAATQLFTTDWVVKYLIDNSVGRYWIERNPESKLADELEYFVKPKNGEIKYVDEKITPQDVTVFDPCVGSGHFLVYAFEVLMKIYVEFGYSERDAATEILKNNLFGVDIDGRAAQLAYFAVMMKARQYDRRFFTRNVHPRIYEIIESNNADISSIQYFYGNDSKLQNDVKLTLDTLHNAKEYGSILQMPEVDFGKIEERFTELEGEVNLYNPYLFGEFRTFINEAEVLSKKYAVVATNPPYLNKYDAKLKDYINSMYKDYSGDLFSVFMYRNFDFCIKDGYSGFMTPFVWMFIRAYESLRDYIINNKSISSLIQMEYSAYEEATVPICSFVLKNGMQTEKMIALRLSKFKGGMEVQKQKVLEGLKDENCKYIYSANPSDFKKIQGAPIAYWASKEYLDVCESGVTVSSLASPKTGMTTGDNNRFLRLWGEVSSEKLMLNATSKDDAKNSGAKWFPYLKGGDFRRWYGNNEYVVNWYNDGHEIKNNIKPNGAKAASVRSEQLYFKPLISWSAVSSSTFACRYNKGGSLFDSGGSSLYIEDNRFYVLALLNSKVGQYALNLTNPTINYQPGDIAGIPLRIDEVQQIEEITRSCVELSKDDWDSFENSWDFTCHPLMKKLDRGKGCATLISDIYNSWECECENRFEQLQKKEEELNEILIRIYGLQDEITPEIDDRNVTVRKADKQRDIRSLLSYAVGCMFGRYSLDETGLIFAGGEWDSSKYRTYTPDADAIIPICDDEYFSDDIVGRFIEFVKTVYGEDTLEENLQFIADALGGSGSAREVIRNYFINDFYTDHVKIYQKRPIYWLFDSGKKNGFKCLIYMHRYQPDTIARIRTDYVHEQQARYRTAIEETTNRIESANGSDKVKLTKKLNTLKAQDEEIHAYEEKIHHLADQMISIDLDDGVKHNYEIFKDVLAKIK